MEFEFLQRDHIGVQFIDHVGDTLWIEAPIAADAAMRVVGGDDERRHVFAKCLRTSMASAAIATTASASSATVVIDGCRIAAITRSMKNALTRDAGQHAERSAGDIRRAADRSRPEQQTHDGVGRHGHQPHQRDRPHRVTHEMMMEALHARASLPAQPFDRNAMRDLVQHYGAREAADQRVERARDGSEHEDAHGRQRIDRNHDESADHEHCHDDEWRQRRIGEPVDDCAQTIDVQPMPHRRERPHHRDACDRDDDAGDHQRAASCDVSRSAGRFDDGIGEFDGVVGYQVIGHAPSLAPDACWGKRRTGAKQLVFSKSAVRNSSASVGSVLSTLRRHVPRCSAHDHDACASSHTSD